MERGDREEEEKTEGRRGKKRRQRRELDVKETGQRRENQLLKKIVSVLIFESRQSVGWDNVSNDNNVYYDAGTFVSYP